MNYLRSIYKKVIYFLLFLTVKIKIYPLTAILIILSFSKLKNIKFSSKKNKKKILILYKSFGVEDIISTYNKIKSDYEFQVVPRKVFKIIFNSFFQEKKTILNDYNYVSDDPEINKIKLELRDYLFKTFKVLKFLYKLDAIISFNFAYVSERELQHASVQNNIKFIALHKESILFEGEKLIYEDILKNKIGKYYGDYILVYNQTIKDVIANSKITNSNNIYLTGMPRSDVYFYNPEKKEDHVLVLLISNERIFKYLKISKQPDDFTDEELSLFKVSDMIEDIIDTILDIAKNNQHIKFIFKTRLKNDEVTKNQIKIIENRKYENCILKLGGSSNELIKNASLVISFNSTGILESLCSKKKVIVPNFNFNNNKFLQSFTLNLSDSVTYADNKIILKNEILKNINNQNTQSETFSKADREVIDRYIFNSDENASLRFSDTLNKLIT